MNSRTIFWLLLCMSFCAHAQTDHYHYFKEIIPLTSQKGLIAAKSNDIPQSKSIIKRDFGGSWCIVDQDIFNSVSKSGPQKNVYYSDLYNSPEGNELIVSPEIIICFQPELSYSRQMEIIKSANLTVIDSKFYLIQNLFICDSYLDHSSKVLNLANCLAETEGVIFCEPEFIFQGQSNLIPPDPYFEKCWGLHNIGQSVSGSTGTADLDMDIPQAWDITTGSSEIIVVVIDTGVTLNHPDLNVKYAKDFTYENGEGGPVNLANDIHGTPVAGCIAAQINDIGTVGGAPGCSIASARSMFGLDNTGLWYGSSLWTVKALEWAVDIGARVTVNSNRYPVEFASVDYAYSQAREAGIIHFASAGNEASEYIGFPAKLSSVNAVAAIDSRGYRSAYSNYGPDIAFTAPGRNIFTTDNIDLYGFSQQLKDAPEYSVMEGTSFSAPYAASVAALILSVDNSLSPDDVEMLMINSATDLGAPGKDDYFGHGLPNAYWALTMARSNSCRPADINKDNKVNMADMGMISSFYLSNSADSSNLQEVDLDCSGAVDLADIELFFLNWLIAE